MASQCIKIIYTKTHRFPTYFIILHFISFIYFLYKLSDEEFYEPLKNSIG